MPDTGNLTKLLSATDVIDLGRDVTCLLVMSETTPIMSHQNDCLNMSWTRMILVNLPKCLGLKTTRHQYYTKIAGH